MPITISAVPDSSACKYCRPLAALLAAGQQGNRQSCLLRQRPDGCTMLAGEDFRRRHEGGLSAGLDRPRHGEQGHDGLAGSDVALQQPQHPVGLCHVGVDLGQRVFLGSGQPVGQGATKGRNSGPVAHQRPSRALADVGAHQRQRYLSGKDLVIGKPPPCRALRRHVDRVGGVVDAAQRLGETRKSLPLDHVRILPFGQMRERATAPDRWRGAAPWNAARLSADRPAR